MGPHGGDRVAEGGAILDVQAVHRVGVVAAPDLRGIIEHTAIEPPSTAAAPLNENFGEIPPQALRELIHP